MSPRRGALAVLSAIFFVEGFTIAALGPVAPDLAAQTGASLAAIGRIVSMVFLGSLIAQFVSGWAGDRFGRRLVLTVGLCLFAACTALVAISPRLWIALLSAVALGVGYGATTLSVNVMAAELAPEKRASAVNLVNTFYGLGAIAGPLAVSFLIERGGKSLPALWIGAACLALSGLGCLVALPARLPHHGPSDVDAPARARGVSLRDPVLIACGVLLLVYVGSEMSAGFWSAVYLERSTGMDPARSAAATALFWSALTVGRVLATGAGMRVTAEHLMTASVWIACVGAALLWSAHGIAWLSVTALAILGLGFGPIYPTGVAVLTARFPHAAGTATSRMGILAAIGGALLPWAHGLVIAHRPTRDAALLTLAASVVMIAIWEWTRRLAHRPASRATV
jgi:fucose permease